MPSESTSPGVRGECEVPDFRPTPLVQGFDVHVPGKRLSGSDSVGYATTVRFFQGRPGFSTVRRSNAFCVYLTLDMADGHQIDPASFFPNKMSFASPCSARCRVEELQQYRRQALARCAKYFACLRSTKQMLVELFRTHVAVVRNSMPGRAQPALGF